MYILFNRDIELACDESVIRQFGEKIKICLFANAYQHGSNEKWAIAIL